MNAQLGSDPPSASPPDSEAPSGGFERPGVAGWKIVAFVIGGGVLLAGLTLGYQMFQSSRVIGFFGPERIRTIQRADLAIVYVPADADYQGDDAIEQEGLRWRPFALAPKGAPGEAGKLPRNEVDRRGWVHVHPAFLASESYFWDEFPPVTTLEPDAFVRFRDRAGKDGGDGTPVDVYLDWEAAALYAAGQDRALRMTEAKRDALKTFLVRPADETNSEQVAGE